MKMVMAISSFCIICILCLTSLLGLNKTEESTDKITTAIENQRVIEQPIIIEENDNSKELLEIQDQLNEMQEQIEEEKNEEPIIIEKEVIVEKETEEKAPKTYLDRPFGDEILVCEVCEKSGTELKVWYDSNNIKHITCTGRCTEGLDCLYGE